MSERRPSATSPATGDFTGSAGYSQRLWNVTGETWGYKAGVPTTPLPERPGSGMWQVGLRYDTIDLDDGSVIAGSTPTSAPRVVGVLGGEMDTWTLGVNWYWRSNFKFMLNYVEGRQLALLRSTPAPVRVDPADNDRLVNAVMDDNPNILEARVQFYW